MGYKIKSDAFNFVFAWLFSRIVDDALNIDIIRLRRIENSRPVVYYMGSPVSQTVVADCVMYSTARIKFRIKCTVQPG